MFVIPAAYFLLRRRELRRRPAGELQQTLQP
jgi:hypothetical protein